MAKHKRKPAPAKPITTHQLFPAVVALWFGALFGLGSLAVRPSLLESLVIKSRIDLIVPAAAPPLGITARILVALILAAIGAGIGIALARRLARPKPEQRERKRGAGSVVEDSDKLHGGRHFADATTRAPLSVSEDLRPDLASSDGGFGTGGLAPRRRSLAIAHEEVDFVPHDLAPLPGGVPQILDIGEVRISPEVSEAPLELSDYAPAQAKPVELDWNNAAPVQSAPGAEPQAPRQVFQSFDSPAAAPVIASEAFTAHHHDIAQEAAAAAADGRQVFGMPSQPAPQDSPRQIFGQPVIGDHVDPEFVKAAGLTASVFASEAPSPLFPPREAATQIEAGLGMDDLAARLAESMARRRAARSGQTAELQAEPAPESSPAPAPAPFETAVAVLVESEIASPQTAEPEPAMLAVPQPYTPPLGAEPLARFAAPFAAVTSVTAIAEPVTAESDPQPVPSAMRPFDLGGFEEDEASLASLLPPRLIALPPVLAAAPARPEAAAPLTPTPLAAPADEAEIANEGVAEEIYGSLLGVAPAAPIRTGYVRIEEPEAEHAATEPVVIFPGQMTRPIVPVSSEDAGSFRRFDAPASAGQGQPIAANQALSEVDSEEAQRALRSALANLQRMSGAA